MKKSKYVVVFTFFVFSILFAFTTHFYADSSKQCAIRLYVANEPYQLQPKGEENQNLDFAGVLSYSNGSPVVESFEPHDYKEINDWEIEENHLGSYSKPYKTIQHAVDMVRKHQEANPGNGYSYTIFVKNGYYPIKGTIVVSDVKHLVISGAPTSNDQSYEIPVIEFQQHEIEDQPSIISSTSLTSPSISAPAVDCSSAVPAMLVENASNITIQNLNLSGGESAVLQVKNSSYITVRYCDLSLPINIGCGTGVIDTWKSSPLTIIDNNLTARKATSNGDYTNHAIYVIGYKTYTGGNDFLIRDNYCEDGGIKLRGADSSGIRNALVTYNIIDGPKSGFVLAKKAHSLKINYNTVYSNYYTAIPGLHTSDIGWGIRFENNTVHLKGSETKYWWKPKILVHGFSSTSDYNNIYIMQNNQYYGNAPIGSYYTHVAWVFTSLQDFLNTKDFGSSFN
jgi:hypothetical protein